MKRRSFLKTAGGAVASTALSVPAAAKETEAAPDGAQSAGLPRRVLGRTGLQVSIVGFPGLGLVHDEQEVCTKALHDAFARGVNYYDVAPAYGNGDAEIKMGIGLQGIDRSKIYQSLVQQRLTLLARRYLRDLRRQANVDLRL